jgi:hypothetical protein
VQRLVRENTRLEQRIRQLESSAISASFSSQPNTSAAAQASTSSAASVAPPATTLAVQQQQQVLQTRCEVLVKEREAVQTIMEQKIKVLVQSVAHAMGAVLQSAPQGGGTAGHALSKVSYLKVSLSLEA